MKRASASTSPWPFGHRSGGIRPVTIVLATVFLITSSVAGCGSDSNDDGGDEIDFTRVAIAQFYVALASARCQRLADCCDADERMTLELEEPDLTPQSNCVRHFIEEFDRDFLTLMNAVEDGDVTFNRSMVSLCLTDTRSCGALDNCDEVIKGRLPLGASCSTSFDEGCSEGTCRSSDNGFVCSTGEAGSPCLLDSGCEHGLFCSFDSDVCEARKSAGEECLLDSECLSGDCVTQAGPDTCAAGDPEPPPVTLDRCDGTGA